MASLDAASQLDTETAVNNTQQNGNAADTDVSPGPRDIQLAQTCDEKCVEKRTMQFDLRVS